MDKCILCDGSDCVNVSDVVCVKRGLQTLIDTSLKKQDGIADQLQNTCSVNVHVECRKKYTRHVKCSENEDKENCPVPAKRRSTAQKFDFKIQCLYCGGLLESSFGLKTPVKRRSQVCAVTSKDAANRILDRAKEVGGDQGTSVMARVQSVLDLRAANCRYHLKCYRDFYARDNICSPGRPVDEEKRTAFQLLCEELEADPECQFSVSELTDRLNELAGVDNAYSTKYLKDLLKSHYKEKVIFTDFSGKNSVFCFRGKANKFVYDAWHAERKSDPEEDRARVVKAAAKIILEDIRSRPFDMENYFLGGGLDEDYLVPDSLRLLMQEIIQSKSESRQAHISRCRETLSQAIMSVCRPRSYLSPIQLNVSVYMYQHVGSRNVIDLLHNLGLAASYYETQKFLDSLQVNKAPDEPRNESSFAQFAFDNADYNVRTLTGHGTFHNMGGIKCCTPKSTTALPYTVPRLKDKTELDFSAGRINVLNYERPKVPGLKKVKVQDLGIERYFPSMSSAFQLDTLWMASFCIPKELVPTPAWNGYMEVVHKQCGPYDVSAVDYLPFINMDPTDLSCIYTALYFAQEQCRKQGQRTCFVTFDQPLYIKAEEIVASSPELMLVIVRLGGFHFLMSFLGTIGHIYSGSGLEELLATVYAKNTVPHIMSGHAFARAVRAHSLVQLAIAKILIKEAINSDDMLMSELGTLHTKMMKVELSADEALQEFATRKVSQILQDRCKEVASQSRTAKLWVEYFNQVELVRMFIRSERTSQWKIHIDTMKAMLPFFPAAGHLPYTKAAHLYIQSMSELHKKMDPTEFEKFTSRGYFSIRRTDKFWSGTSVDLTIEQMLMRHLKTSGLTRGRGITDSTLAKFVAALPQCVPLSHRFEEFCGVRQESSEQHVELRDSRQVRDEHDLGLFTAWFESHCPFEERPADMLLSLSTGMVADETVNCDRAWDVGLTSIQAMMGKNFADLKLKRNDKVKPLAAMSNNITVDNEEVIINPNQLFNRIICMLNANNGSLSEYLSYELSPKPPSLFDEISLRKTEKSALAHAIAALSPPDEDPPDDTLYVVDGGMLLRSIVWPRPATYNVICDSYKSYATRRYGSSATVVFDGYEENHLSTKAEEQRRRCLGKTSPTLQVGLEMVVVTAQANFLGNASNKASLIRILTPILESAGMTVLQAPGDADTMIVETALKFAGSNRRVTVAATDTDILAMLIQRSSPSMKTFLHAPGTSGKAHKVYNISEIRKHLGPLKEVILFAHAMTGSDTTSALFGKGKVSILKILKANPSLLSKAKIFNTKGADIEEICSTGEDMLLALYNAGTHSKTLNDLRFALYNKNTGKQKLHAEVHLKTLPPTSAAARQHSLRVYLQVQEWTGNRLLDPTKYGWRKVGNPPRLVPVASELPPAPEKLLKLVRCDCKKGCTISCECRRSGMLCTAMCGTCHGIDCSNCNEHDSDDENAL